jgi:Methyltransferase domain
MHSTALQIGKLFFENYWRDDFKRILDVGSKDVNGTLRQFRPPGAEYVGIDLAAGEGVDRVLADPYQYPFDDNYFDVIVSTSCFEHDRMFWLTFLECSRVLSMNGYLYINAPSSGIYHGYPYDHWRFYPDAALALEEWSARMNKPLKCIESFIADQLVGCFNDCVMIFSRNEENKPRQYVSDVAKRAFNIRRGTNGPLINQQLEPRIQLELTHPNQKLKVVVSGEL